MKRYLLPMLFAVAAALVVLNATQGGGEKTSAWKPYLPGRRYAVLTERSIQAIEMTAKSGAKDAAERIEFEAAILAGYTLAVKNAGGDEVASMRGAALQAAQSARKGELKKLTDFGKIAKSAPKASAEVKDWKPYLQELQWMMESFRNKSKGGDGLHADLQYHPKLKNLNGTEALIGALAGKKLSADNLNKVAKELPNLAYRVAAIGSITHEFAPTKGAGQWRDLSSQMRDASIALAVSAEKKDAEGIMKAAATLENSCTQCHSAFKKS
jgi:hypothetical protein